MAQAIIAIAGSIGSYGSAAGGAYGAYAGVIAGVVYAAGSIAMGAQDQKTGSGPNRVTYNQTMPPRRRVINRSRVLTTDSRMLYEAKRSFYQVNCVCEAHGSLLRFDGFWLHGDRVTVNAPDAFVPNRVNATDGNPNKYKGNGLWLLTRKGLPTETSYFSEGPWHSGEGLADLGPGVWSAQHRGDGIASLLLVCAPVEQANYRNVYPQGQPAPSTLPVLAVYDWRKDSTRGGTGTHRLDDPATWEESWNPILWLAQVESGPIERPDFVARFERKIAGASFASWTLAADDCDDLLPATVGGVPATVARFGIAGAYFDNQDLADIRRQILATCDGFLIEGAAGALHVQAGVYRAPTMTIPLGHIKALRWRRGRRIETAVNELVISYLSPQNDWYVVPGTPWRDEADIALRGVKSKPLELPWTPYHAQARRLAKIVMGQSAADGDGVIRTTLYGLNVLFSAPAGDEVLNRRWINIEREAADGSTYLQAVEITGSPRIDMKTLSVEFPIRAATPDAYDWSIEDDGGGEGTPPPSPILGIGSFDFQHPGNSGLTRLTRL